MNGTMTRELALYESIKHSLSSARTVRIDDPCRSDRLIVTADCLVDVLFEQCSAYHAALQRIVEMARQGGMTDRDIFNVLDNLDQPL